MSENTFSGQGPDNKKGARARRRSQRKRAQRRAAIIAVIAGLLVVILAIVGIRSLIKRDPGSAPLPDEEETEEAAEEEDLRTAEEKLEAEIAEIIAGMTLEDKISQLFVVYPAQLTGEPIVTSAGDLMRSALDEYAVGGIVYDAENFIDRTQISSMLTVTRDMSRYPLFLMTDEEGGEMSQLATAIGVAAQPSAAAVGESGSTEAAQSAGREIGAYVADCGFNTVIAPCANIRGEDETSAASFGTGAAACGEMAVSMMRGLKESALVTCVNHFPVKSEEDYGGSVSMRRGRRTLQEVQNEEFLPFRDCIMTGCEMVMLSNYVNERITGDETPMSLSENLIMGQLRSTLGFNGIVVTDRLNQSAVTRNYTAEQAAVTAFQAGADLLFCPEDFKAAHKALLEAAESGQISGERIDTSLRRIFRVKYREGFR